MRLALTALALGLCCWLAYGFGKFWAEWRRTADAAAVQRVDISDLRPLAAAMPLAGMWSFDELDWSLRSQQMDVHDVDAEFERSAAAPPKIADSQLPEMDQGYVDLLDTFHISPTERAGNLVYRLDRQDVKVQLVVRRVAERSKTVAFAVAYPANGDAWQFYEFTPRPTAAKPDSTAAHLLPLPADARRSGGRFDDDGQTLLEFIELDSTAERLIAAWKDAGWEVRPSGLMGPAAFSYLCARGDEVVYAWSADPPDSLRNLMLVHTPTPADTKL